MFKRKLRPGPKPRPARELRRFQLNIPINAAERKALIEAAGTERITVWARGILLDAAKRRGTWKG